MSRIDDYWGEMGLMTDAEIEGILRGAPPQEASLARLGSVVEELRSFATRDIRPEVISRHVAAAAKAARAVAAPPRPAPGRAVLLRGWRLLPRLGTSLAAFALIIGMTGVAVASDAASPGEPLHGIDVFLEKLGIGDGGNQERISEAQDLSERGMAVEALEHLTSTLTEEDDAGAAEALKTASDRLKGKESGSERSQQVRERVSEMLNWMATTDAKGKEFGQGVAERARPLGADETPEEAGVSGQDQANGAKPGKGAGQESPGKGKGKGKGPKPSR